MRTVLIVVLAAVTAGASAPPQNKPALSTSIDRGIRTVEKYNPKDVAPLASDGEFLRRVMLDLVGYPPTGAQVKAFMADTRPNKRAVIIDALLESPHYHDLWARRLAVVFFGNYHNVTMNTTPPLSAEARARIVADFLWWMRRKLRQDRGWNEVVYEMLDARGTDEGDPALAYKLSFYRDEGHAKEFAAGAARHLLGIRLLCARCHDHPMDRRWSVEHYYSLAAFNVRERARGYGGRNDAARHVRLSYAPTGEMVVPRVEIDSSIVEAGKPGPISAQFFMGGAAGKNDDRMRVLAMLMTRKQNSQLPRALVARVWGWMFGRSLVNPSDDFSLANRPLSKSLLESVTSDFIASKYSMKTLLRGICNSDTYQRTCGSDREAYRNTFTRGAVMPLTAEQLVNSIQVATGGVPGRNPAQAMGLVSSLFPAGAVWCEVTPLPSNARQALLLRNNNEISGWIRSGTVLSGIRSASLPPGAHVDELFLAVLSRRPTESERARYATFLRSQPSSGLEDALWTLLNSTEFVTRH